MGSDVRQSIKSSAIDPHYEQQRNRPLWKITTARGCTSNR